MKNKRNIVVFVVLTIFIFSFITFVYYNNYDKNIEDVDMSMLSIMLEDESGEYVKSDVTDFPQSGYVLNDVESYCVFGSPITWDDINKTITVQSDGADNCYLYFDKLEAVLYEFAYTGDYQEFVVPSDGLYKFEAWGASGTSNFYVSSDILYGGSGSYVSGEIDLLANDVVYIYVGENKSNITSANLTTSASYLSAFNGGGAGKYDVDNTAVDGESGFPGGGATDFRLVSGPWNDTTGLNSRILVAAGGGGSGHAINHPYYDTGGNHGGGLIGYAYAYTGSVTPTQISGFAFGYGSPSVAINISGDVNSGGSGGGYYGGQAVTVGTTSINYASGTSGSSYISGHTGAVAITSDSDRTPKTGCTTGTTDNDCSIHYSNSIFTNTVMIDGAGYNWTNVKGEQVQMPNPSGELYDLGTGHSGNGYARISGPL